MVRVHLGIGANLGDREAACLRSVALLNEKGIMVLKQSSLHETEPWGMMGQPRFINMAVEAQTILTPEELLDVLKMIEREMGRDETGRWGPRTIDLDILLYDGLVVKSELLSVPHPLMHERSFVLDPLVEIAPEVVHPVLKRTVLCLKEELDDRHRQREE